MEKIVSKAVIDKTLFARTIQVLACHVSTKAIGEFQRKFKAWLLKMPSAKTVLNHESNESEKYVLLSREYGSEVEKLPQNLRDFLKENQIEAKPFNLDIDYNNYTCHEALERILPDGVMIPTGFESVGHIAHMNLGEEHTDFKYQIGQIFLDKNPSIRTVLTKVGFIENVFKLNNGNWYNLNFF